MASEKNLLARKGVPIDREGFEPGWMVRPDGRSVYADTPNAAHDYQKSGYAFPEAPAKKKAAKKKASKKKAAKK